MLMGDGPAPALPKFAEGGWRIINGRPPDVILEMPMTYELPAEGQIPVFRIWDKNPSRKTSSLKRCRFCRRTPPSRTTRRSTAASCRKASTLKKGIGWRNSPGARACPDLS
ncbi:MAG: hypothetical protein U0Q11_18935 [Vicinamibacterales bacterium]